MPIFYLLSLIIPHSLCPSPLVFFFFFSLRIILQSGKNTDTLEDPGLTLVMTTNLKGIPGQAMWLTPLLPGNKNWATTVCNWFEQGAQNTTWDWGLVPKLSWHIQPWVLSPAMDHTSNCCQNHSLPEEASSCLQPELVLSGVVVTFRCSGHCGVMPLLKALFLSCFLSSLDPEDVPRSLVVLGLPLAPDQAHPALPCGL